MNIRIARKLHKVATSGLSWDEYRRRVPRDRELRAMKRWKRYYRKNRWARYWMPITRIIENNSLKDMVDLPTFSMEYSYSEPPKQGLFFKDLKFACEDLNCGHIPCDNGRLLADLVDGRRKLTYNVQRLPSFPLYKIPENE